ncbi:MAG: DNA cytosine methyltransferase [Spirosomataceae bacterium]
MFAGIGGFHYALKSFGAACVLASEIDKKAAKQYLTNHGLLPEGDVKELQTNTIPEYDILCAGFPCQAFSISGKQKGFKDPRGTLFFEITRIVADTKPKILFLENVKNINRHNDGETIEVIIKELANVCYTVFIYTFNTSNFGLPQNRERTYFIAFNNDEFLNSQFTFPEMIISSSLKKIIEDNPKNTKYIEREDVTYSDKIIDESKEAYNRPLQIGKISKGRQGERIYHISGHAVTLSASGGGIGAKTGIYLINGKLRKLTGRECARIQGFPESYILPKTELEAHKQFGNSVSVDVIQYILEEIGKTIIANERTPTTRLEYS